MSEQEHRPQQNDVIQKIVRVLTATFERQDGFLSMDDVIHQCSRRQLPEGGRDLVLGALAACGVSISSADEDIGWEPPEEDFDSEDDEEPRQCVTLGATRGNP